MRSIVVVTVGWCSSLQQLKNFLVTAIMTGLVELSSKVVTIWGDTMISVINLGVHVCVIEFTLDMN